MVPVVLALAAVAALFLVGWVVTRRRFPVDEPTPASEPTVFQLEERGRRDGLANVPNDLTQIPFPTPEMGAIYGAGERRRYELESAYQKASAGRRVRERIAAARVGHLGKALANAAPATEAALASDLARSEQLLAGVQSAIDTAEKEYLATLAAVDATTEERIDTYWAANLRARDRDDPDLATGGIDALTPPRPSSWREQRDDTGYLG